MALFPVAVVATGIVMRSASSASSVQARAAWTPLPARITGLDAARMTSATCVTSDAAGFAVPCARCRVVSCTRGGRRVFTVPPSERLLQTTATGPRVPVVACLMASWIVCTACLGSETAAVYLVALDNRFRRSWLPCSPVPDWYGEWCMKGAMSVKSPSSSIGEAPFTASSVPKSALHARKMPCPMTTPGLPVSRPYISAMMEPTCSWRTRTVWIAFESWSASKMRPVSPPGMPKTNWMPASSRTRTMAWGTSVSSGIIRPSSSEARLPPQLLGRDPRALGHRLELGPGDLRLHLVDRSRECHESTIGACDHPLAPDDLGVADETLSDQLRVLDEVGRRVQHTRDDHPVVGQADLAEHDPLVLVARVGPFEREGLGLRLQRDRQELTQRDVPMVRALVVAPAEVQAHPVGRNIAQGVIQHLDVGRGDLEELGVAQLVEHEVPPHRQVGAVDLEHEPSPIDRVVLLLHDVPEAGQVRIAARVVLVLHEVRDDAGRSRRHECVRRLDGAESCLEVGEVLLDRCPVLPLDRAVARRAQDRRAPLAARSRRGKVGPVRARRHRRLTVEAGEAMAHVGGIADLPLLAVVDDVDAGVELLLDDLADGAGHARLEGRRVGHGAGVERLERGRQILGAGKASGVRGQDAVGAELHRRCLRPRRSCTSGRCSSSSSPSR